MKNVGVTVSCEQMTGNKEKWCLLSSSINTAYILMWLNVI